MMGRRAGRRIVAVLLSFAEGARLWVFGLFFSALRTQWLQANGSTEIFIDRVNATS